MSLQHDLAALAAEMGAKFPPEIREKMGAATARLAESAEAQAYLKAGAKAPDFSLKNQKGETVTLSTILGHGPLVLVFYRGEWCPYCNLELRAYQRQLDAITAAGGTLLAISPEQPDHSLMAAEKNELSYDVLSDEGLKVSSAFGLTFALDESLQPIYESFGIDLPGRNGSGDWRLPIPATFVIAGNGDIVYAAADVDYTKRPKPSDVLQALQNLSTKAA